MGKENGLRPSNLLKGENLSGGVERNYGIDLLRILVAFFVCVVHVLGVGGKIIDATNKFSVLYETACFMEIAVYCAVDCFAMISGYVGLNSKHKHSGLIYLWLQVIFISVFTTVVGNAILGQAFNFKDVLYAAVPFFTWKYWYFNAYVGLHFLMPLLDYAINNMPRKTIKGVLITLIGFATVYSVIDGNVFNLNGGYSVLWLALLYLIGGYIRKYQPFSDKKTWKLLLYVFVLIVFTWAWKLTIELSASYILPERYTAFFLSHTNMISYVSPTILLVSLFVLIVCQRLKFKQKPKLIAFLAPLAFGVCIGQVHKAVWYYIAENADMFAEMNVFLFVLAVLATASGVFLVALIVDLIRYGVFSLLRVKKILTKLEDKIKNKFRKEENV